MAGELRAVKLQLEAISGPRAFDAGEWGRFITDAKTPAGRLLAVQEGLRQGFIIPAQARKLLEFEDGLAATPVKGPDNSVAWLDEDLLCEDV